LDKSHLRPLPFQSLSGFLARCDMCLQSAYWRSMGFNPCRVFSLVATVSLIFLFGTSLSVSIPVGFSRSLRRVCGRDDIGIDDRFQSLSGFLARCD
jgi:hypothetical protein